MTYDCTTSAFPLVFTLIGPICVRRPERELRELKGRKTWMTPGLAVVKRRSCTSERSIRIRFFSFYLKPHIDEFGRSRMMSQMTVPSLEKVSQVTVPSLPWNFGFFSGLDWYVYLMTCEGSATECFAEVVQRCRERKNPGMMHT